MNDQSPPKRITRARAAAKSETNINTNTNTIMSTKIATAASKAKVTRATSTKRKTRADEVQDDEKQDRPERIVEPEPKITRGRFKKVAESELEPKMQAPPLKALRGRPRKTTDTAKCEPTRLLRGRPRKLDISEEGSAVVEESLKRSTRGRAATVKKPEAQKRSVKFEEPDKENIAPTSGRPKMTESGTGLRAKPVRKPAVGRATRRRKPVEEVVKSSPLSPKKTAQVSSSRESSGDELAATKMPIKPLMKSPVKPPGSVPGIVKKMDFPASVTIQHTYTATHQHHQDSAVRSPARRPPQVPSKKGIKLDLAGGSDGASMPQSPLKMSLPVANSDSDNKSLKGSLFQSPARRPPSPIKASKEGSPTRSTKNFKFDATPRTSTFKISRFATPRTLTKSFKQNGSMNPINISTEGSPEGTRLQAVCATEPNLGFSGRLSSIVPREVDPIVSSTSMTELQKSNSGEQADQSATLKDTMVVATTNADLQSTPILPMQNNFLSRAHEPDDPFQDSDSEDELVSSSLQHSPAPLNGIRTSFPGLTLSNTSTVTVTKTADSDRYEKIGFTPLAQKLGDWMTASTENTDGDGFRSETLPASVNIPPETAEVDPSMKSTFFEDEMQIRDELEGNSLSTEQDLEANFGAVQLDEEDIELAIEANQMSIMDPNQVEVPESTLPSEQMSEQIIGPQEPTPSEASQEYEDENAMPIDPDLISLSKIQPMPSTPKRVLSERIFHTVSKVPLKLPADETPMRPLPMKRSASIAKLASSQPSLFCNTIISCSPLKSTATRFKQGLLTTPSKQDADWSTLGTPARTPRPDLYNDLLRGAVIFVDVYTIEGADASVLFTELLTQMGARCVKSWSWNGNEEDGKIGITHVVYKDGGKRTLEKARESGGVVACVGVGWVLDCERENKWLDETPYLVDTAIIPRGGARRRKSMEPRALANLNGTIVSFTTPNRKSLVNGETPMTTYARRRDTVQWIRSPSAVISDIPDEQSYLSPVPATPAPETISAYGLDGLDGDGDTPAGQTPYYLNKEQLLQKTAPAPIHRYVDTEEQEHLSSLQFGKGDILPEKHTNSVMMRLMAARRKSLQWAPKVGSPLARGC